MNYTNHPTAPMEYDPRRVGLEETSDMAVTLDYDTPEGKFGMVATLVALSHNGGLSPEERQELDGLLTELDKWSSQKRIDAARKYAKTKGEL
jgi:hypothetical protein